MPVTDEDRKKAAQMGMAAVDQPRERMESGVEAARKATETAVGGAGEWRIEGAPPLGLGRVRSPAEIADWLEKYALEIEAFPGGDPTGTSMVRASQAGNLAPEGARYFNPFQREEAVAHMEKLQETDPKATGGVYWAGAQVLSPLELRKVAGMLRALPEWEEQKAEAEQRSRAARTYKGGGQAPTED